MTNARAVRYRQFAQAEPDPAKAELFRRLTARADRDVLCVAEKRLHSESLDVIDLATASEH